MKKKARILQVSGFRGIVFFMFLISGLVMGFVISPGFIAMGIWNHLSATYGAVPLINIFQGVLLWAMIALAFYMTNNKKNCLSFHQATQLDDKELKDLMEKVKLQSQAKNINSMILNSEDIKKIKPKKECFSELRSASDGEALATKTRFDAEEIIDLKEEVTSKEK